MLFIFLVIIIFNQSSYCAYSPCHISLLIFPSSFLTVRVKQPKSVFWILIWWTYQILLACSCHSTVLPLHDVLLFSVLKCPCICIDLTSIHFRSLSLLFAQSWTYNWYNFTTGMSFLRDLLSSTPPLMSNIWNNSLPQIITPFWCEKRNTRPRLLFEEIR